MGVRRGTTPVNFFEFPEDTYDPSTFAVLFVTYVQNEKTIIEKTLSDCTINGQTVSVPLTQEDTLLLESVDRSKPCTSNGLVEIQLRFRTVDGVTDATDIITVPVDKVLKDGMI